MTEDAYKVAQEPQFGVGRVLEDGFETLFRIFPRALAMCAIIAVPLLVWLFLGGARALVLVAPLGQFQFDAKHFDLVPLIVLGILLLTNLFIQAAVVDAAFQDMLGEEVDILASLRSAVVAAPSLLAAGCILFLALIGWLFLVGALGGLFGLFGLGYAVGSAISATVVLVMATVRWWVFLPAIVVERIGPFAGFGRSTRLTERRRWSIFAILLLIYVPEYLLKLVLVLVAAKTGVVASGIMNIVISGLFIVLNATITTAIYGHLRAEKEGSGTAHLAEVFE